jgi:hypothetical protein
MSDRSSIGSTDSLGRDFGKATIVFIVTLALYFFTRSPGLDEWDSVQFAMGVRAFDMWKHHPHPPGYPLFILFGWLADRLFGVGPVLSLHFASAAGGAAFVAVWFLIIRSQFTERLAWWVTISLALTPEVWMNATKVLTDPPAAAFLSAEILAAIYYRERRSSTTLLGTSLLGAIAVGIRPQLILTALMILSAALKKEQVGRWLIALGSFVAAGLLWLIPTSYLQAQINKSVPVWRVYFDLSYSQWIWRLDRPDAYIGAGDWSPKYLATRFVFHILGWFGLGLGFLESIPILVVGIVIATFGLLSYVLSRRELEDKRFWRFHAPWALVYIAIIFACLPEDPRYYIIIFPLLLVALLRGFLRLRTPWNMAALTIPAFLIWVVTPLAIENHREAAPPIRLVEHLEQLYPPSMRGNVVLLFKAARRHAQWYAPEFNIPDPVPEPDVLRKITKDAVAVYVDDPNTELPNEWRRVLLMKFSRPMVVYHKNHVVPLFQIDRGGGQ